MAPETRAAAFLVRVWWEGEDRSFRARVTHRLDLEHGRETTIVTADVEEVHRLLDAWLGGLRSPG